MGHLVGRLKLDRSQSMREKVGTLVAAPKPLFRRRLPQPLSTIFLTICEAQVTPLRAVDCSAQWR